MGLTGHVDPSETPDNVSIPLRHPERRSIVRRIRGRRLFDISNTTKGCEGKDMDREETIYLEVRGSLYPRIQRKGTVFN